MKFFPTLHLSPDAADGAGASTETRKTGDTVADLAPDTLAGIESALATLEATGKLDASAEGASALPPAETAEQKTAREAKAQSEQKKPGETPAATAGTAVPPTFTAEQQAWLDQRTAAATAEEVQALDATMPVFTEEQWKFIDEQQKADFRQDAGSTLTETAEQKTAREAATAEAAKLKTDFEAAQAEITALKQQLATATQSQTPVAVAPLDPLLMVTNPVELDQAEANLNSMARWALKHWDGAEATAASADGKVPAQPAYTAEQVRNLYAAIQERKDSVLPLARQALAEHIGANVNAQKIYPEIFEKDNPHQLQAANLLRSAPGLRAVIPNIHTVIGDAMIGEKLRALLLSEKGNPELAAALVKADPSLKKFMPLITGKTTSAGSSLRLPRKPIVPLARPAPSGGAARPQPTGRQAPRDLEKAHAQASNQNGEMAALIDLVKAELPGIPVLSPAEARE